MSEVIAKLQKDHRRMEVILGVLDRKIANLTEGNNLNLFMIRTILDYIVNFPQKCHHPIENFLLRSLTRRNPQAGAISAEILNEHEMLANIVTRFVHDVECIEPGAPILKDELVATLNAYEDLLVQHMQKEEEFFFPAAEEYLIQADWDVIETRMRDKGDPVFGREADREYRALHKVIIEWGGK